MAAHLMPTHFHYLQRGAQWFGDAAIFAYLAGMDDKRYKGLFRIATARARWHTYDGGVYFVTICVRGREHCFGRVEGDGMVLTAAGEVVRDCWDDIGRHHEGVDASLLVVMPDHLHGIVFIDGTTDRATTLGTVMRGFKSAVTRRARQARLPFPGWQARYHDRIVRDEAELRRVVEYAEANPTRWDDGGGGLHHPHQDKI